VSSAGSSLAEKRGIKSSLGGFAEELRQGAVEAVEKDSKGVEGVFGS